MLYRQAKLLLVRRAAGVARGGFWCFPGGHLEAGETSRDALTRELREELGIEAAPSQRMGSLRLADAGYVLAVWRVDQWGGQIQPAPEEIEECRWLTPQQIRETKPALPSNKWVLEMLSV